MNLHQLKPGMIFNGIRGRKRKPSVYRLLFPVPDGGCVPCLIEPFERKGNAMWMVHQSGREEILFWCFEGIWSLGKKAYHFRTPTKRQLRYKSIPYPDGGSNADCAVVEVID